MHPAFNTTEKSNLLKILSSDLVSYWNLHTDCKKQLIFCDFFFFFGLSNDSVHSLLCYLEISKSDSDTNVPGLFLT